LLQFRQENPEFTFRIWSPSECDEFVRSNFGHHPISEVYFRAKFGPLAADIWRYLVLLKFGGWYFDINKRVTGGLLQFMSPDCELVLSYERNLFSGDTSLSQGIDHPQNAVCNWGIGAAPDNPVLQRLIADICEDTPLFSGRVWRKPKEAIIDYTGPRRLTRTLHKFVGQFGAAGICQAGIDFHGQGDFDMAGSWVRYLTNPPYAAARDQPILT
jgi:mannosyltransferase OCH1-like enzyme